MIKRILFLVLIAFLSVIIGLPTYVLLSSGIPDPDIAVEQAFMPAAKTNDSILYFKGNNWIQQNDHGLYELYVEGDGLQLGLMRGLLSEKLIHKQEQLFVEKIQELVPSRLYLFFLKEMVSWFNRNLPDYISEEYLREIYGISRFADNDFDFIGNKYERVLNYHAAHDIGHALQNYNLVGCTSFSQWNKNKSDMIIGRNFDFSMGEKFAENKIVCFYHPANGIDFMMVSWSDFIGCVSGMNRAGLTVTINAGENTIPTGIGTPISLIAREILQYARNIDEAYKIAMSRKSFVSESILIGSAEDSTTVVVEKTPDTTLLVYPQKQSITCSNHFQSEALKKKQDSGFMNATQYRFARIQNLMDKSTTMDEHRVAAILRDQQGLDDKDIGMGNEKTINQLVAHHSVIFKPYERKFWISLPPFQLGAYLCYDLNEVFSKKAGLKKSQVNYISELTIPADAFLQSEKFAQFRQWQQLKKEIVKAIEDESTLPKTTIEAFIALNPNYYESYEVAANYLAAAGNKNEAMTYFRQALEKEVPNHFDVARIRESMTELEENK